MLLNSHISAYATCFAGKVCGLVRSTWGTSQGEDKLGARDRILNTKVARRACAGQTHPSRRRSHKVHGTGRRAHRAVTDRPLWNPLAHARCALGPTPPPRNVRRLFCSSQLSIVGGLGLESEKDNKEA